MKQADKLLLKNGFDLKGNYTGKRIEILNKRQKIKRRSKPYIKDRRKAAYSPAEFKIAEFLTKNKIRFHKEYYMRGCCSRNGFLLFFDFYLPDYNAVIEFDGLHHFKPIYGIPQFEHCKDNDRRKNWFCKVRNIPLLRIPCFTKDIEKAICGWFDKNF